MNVTATNVTASIDPATATALFITYAVPEFLSRLSVFFIAPFLYADMWWLLGHLVLTFVMFEFYFERHSDEELGWSAALANSIVMMFISMELIRAMYHHVGSPFEVIGFIIDDYLSFGLTADKTIIISLVLLLGAMGLATAIINYFHLLPRRLAWIFSGHKTVNILAYFLMVVVWRYTHDQPLSIDGFTILAGFCFGIIVWFSLFLLTKTRKKSSSRGLFN